MHYDLHSRIRPRKLRMSKARYQPIITGLILAILFTLLLGWLGFRLTGRVKKSLANLEVATRSVGANQLGVRAPILYPDEIGKLTDSFNRMIRNLEETTVSRNLLEEKNKELEQFTYIASHDLQEPLRKISAYGDVLVEDYAARLDEGGKEHIQIMQNAAARMQQLIESLLTYSRVMRRQEPFERIDLNGLLKEVCSDLEVAIRESGATIAFDALPVIHGDPLQMRQLFQNLIGNAIKFSRKGVPPQIKIDSRPLDDRLTEIKVADNGIGFETKYIEKIFLPFHRLHTRDEYKGTGIGLAICKKVVERHGGSITAESRLGLGTTFVIQLAL